MVRATARASSCQNGGTWFEVYVVALSSTSTQPQPYDRISPTASRIRAAPPAAPSTWRTVVSLVASGTLEDYTPNVTAQIAASFAAQCAFNGRIVDVARVSVQVTPASVNLLIVIEADSQVADRAED